MVAKENTPVQAERTSIPTVLVVSSDPSLLKLFTIALSLELACEILTVDSARKAEEAAKHLKPSLLILDQDLTNHRTLDLSDSLHRIEGLEQLPTLFFNAAVLPQSESFCYPTCFLGWIWKLEALYAAVRALLA